MAAYRSFSDDVEATAKFWRGFIVSRRQWKFVGVPGSAGGEAKGTFVRASTLDGFAKPTHEKKDSMPRAAHEKIASDLAFELGLPVPPVVLWRRKHVMPDEEPCVAVSLVPFNPAHKWGHVSKTNDAARRVIKSLHKAAAAMMVFDTWVDNRDRANEGNLIVHEGRPETGSTIQCAYIDYAYSMAYGWRISDDFKAVTAAPIYPKDIKVDKSTVGKVVGAIETLSDDMVRLIVQRIPTDFVPRSQRALISDGLLHRRSELRAVLQSAHGRAT